MLCFLLMLALLPSTALAENMGFGLSKEWTSSQDYSADKTENNGELVIYVLKDKGWQRVGSLSFGRFLSENSLVISGIADHGETSIRVVQSGGGHAHLDAVLLGGNRPIRVNGEDAHLKKLSEKDYDVANLGDEGIEVSFAGIPAVCTLEVAARIEPEVISETPFLFPVQQEA